LLETGTIVEKDDDIESLNPYKGSSEIMPYVVARELSIRTTSQI
jgi:hypothetical protein